MKQNEILVIRESIGRIVSMLTNRSVKVTMRGSRAYVAYHPKTGQIESLNIPYIPDDASDDFIAAIQGFLDHEVGHILYSEFDALKKATAAGPRTANLANIIEDVFVERKMTEGFRGSGHNLDSLRKFYLEKIARVKIEGALAAGDMETARGYATVTAFRAWGGQTSAMDFIKDPKIAALIEPVAAKLGAEVIEQVAKCDSSADCLALAVICKNKLETPKPPPPPPPEAGDKMLDAMKKAGKLSDALEAPPPEPEPADEDDKGEAEDEGTVSAADDDSGKSRSDKDDELEPVEGETSPGDSGGDEDRDPDAEPGEADMSSGPTDEPEDGAPAGEDEGTTGRGESSDDAEDEDASEGDSGMAPDPLADMLDKEHDFDKDISEKLSESAAKEINSADYAVFSCEWDKVIPAPLAASKDSVDKVEAGLRDKIGVMQKQLERAMAAKARKSWNPGMRRGRIAPGSLFKTSVGDDRVFRQRFETKGKNTAVSLVIDCSGSMKSGKIELAGNAAYALAAVMERLKLEYEVIGFTTGYSGEMSAMMESDAKAQGKTLDHMKWGRVEPLYMPVFKPFDGKLDSAARSRIAHLTEHRGLGWLNQNVDGECVQLAARRLVKRTAERHILMVLSDGAPCAYSALGLNAHLKKTVKEVVAQGVEVIGIGIATTSVKQFYPKNVVLNNIEELPSRVMGELTKLLMAA